MRTSAAWTFLCQGDLAGPGVLRFDFTGLGASGGELANTRFSSNVEDLVRAAAMLRDRYRAQALLVGHSLGGAAVLAAAPSIPEVTAVATIGAPFDPGHITHLFPPNTLAELERAGEADVQLAGPPDLRGRPALQELRVPRRRRPPPHPGHRRQLRRDRARRPGQPLPVRPAPTPTDDHDQPSHEGTVTITDAGPGALHQTIRGGRHRLTADEPPGIGDDLGLTPSDLLLAALGTCTSMTLRMYADRHDWPLEHVTVQLHHDRVHADACRDPEAHPTLAIRAQRHCASSTGEPPRTCARDGCCT